MTDMARPTSASSSSVTSDPRDSPSDPSCDSPSSSSSSNASSSSASSDRVGMPSPPSCDPPSSSSSSSVSRPLASSDRVGASSKASGPASLLGDITGVVSESAVSGVTSDASHSRLLSSGRPSASSRLFSSGLISSGASASSSGAPASSSPASPSPSSTPSPSLSSPAAPTSSSSSIVHVFRISIPPPSAAESPERSVVSSSKLKSMSLDRPLAMVVSSSNVSVYDMLSDGTGGCPYGVLVHPMYRIRTKRDASDSSSATVLPSDRWRFRPFDERGVGTKSTDLPLPSGSSFASSAAAVGSQASDPSSRPQSCPPAALLGDIDMVWTLESNATVFDLFATLFASLSLSSRSSSDRAASSSAAAAAAAILAAASRGDRGLVGVDPGAMAPSPSPPVPSASDSPSAVVSASASISTSSSSTSPSASVGVDSSPTAGPDLSSPSSDSAPPRTSLEESASSRLVSVVPAGSDPDSDAGSKTAVSLLGDTDGPAAGFSAGALAVSFPSRIIAAAVSASGSIVPLSASSAPRFFGSL
mmetsp:Transcript_7053/g.16330  ORF Transcript_7053/g.16330 Transcript_7053/m.16330 type:complete len:531 (-) Transcript_7053:5-1597(-)